MTDLDFNSSRTKRDVFNERMIELFDAASMRLYGNEAPRAYNVSPSLIGDECLRRIQFESTRAPGKPFDGRTLRIFQRGHIFEPVVLNLLTEAGFVISANTEDGRQHGFSAAAGQFRGRLDGIVQDGPSDLGLTYPCVWESKALGDKGFKATLKDGVAKAHPKYADQVGTYQGYMDLDAPALFTALNVNTMEIYSEAVAFNEERAQNATDRAVMIIRANKAGELLGRAGGDPDKFPCAWCRFKDHCWADGELGPVRSGEGV